MQQLDDKYMPKGDLEIFKSNQELRERLNEIDSNAIIYESGSEPKLVKKEENKKREKQINLLTEYTLLRTKKEE
ncbi:MAG: hypothetical protein GY936_10320 [Ignavibacteriae bacterium]|nr:hypothetical protein [Ignavibacteriota bacterium]